MTPPSFASDILYHRLLVHSYVLAWKISIGCLLGISLLDRSVLWIFATLQRQLITFIMPSTATFSSSSSTSVNTLAKRNFAQATSGNTRASSSLGEQDQERQPLLSSSPGAEAADDDQLDLEGSSHNSNHSNGTRKGKAKGESPRRETPLPWGQMTVLICMRFAEPICFSQVRSFSAVKGRNHSDNSTNRSSLTSIE